jgi:hypothetical protein
MQCGTGSWGRGWIMRRYNHGLRDGRSPRREAAESCACLAPFSCSLAACAGPVLRHLSPHGLCLCRSRTTQRGRSARQSTTCGDGSRLSSAPCAWCPQSALVGTSAQGRSAAESDEQRRAQRRAGWGQEPGAAGAHQAPVPDSDLDSPAEAHLSCGRGRAPACHHARPRALGNGNVGASRAQARRHG